MSTFIVVKLKHAGLNRVLNGAIGMTFIVDKFTDRVAGDGKMAHVRDYRDHGGATFGRPFQIWSIPPEGYEVCDE